MSAPPKRKRKAPPPPIILLPREKTTTGPATLLLGSGIPGALVQVWNIENTHSLGGGRVSDYGRWAFSISGLQSPGDQGIKAHQTWNGVTSEWSEARRYTVLLRPEIDVPVVFEPKEGAQVDTVPVFSGDVTQASGFVNIIDLDNGEVIAEADVDSLKQWRTQVTLPPGLYRTSAIHNIEGTVSDWGRVRTFTVTAGGKGKGKT